NPKKDKKNCYIKFKISEELYKIQVDCKKKLRCNINNILENISIYNNKKLTKKIMISPILTRISKHKKQYDHINQAISQNEIKEKLWQIYTQNTNKNTNKLNA